MIIDAHAHIVVRAAAAGPGRAESWRPQVTEAGGRSRIHHDGRELTSVVREFTDPDRMAAEAAAQDADALVLVTEWKQFASLDLCGLAKRMARAILVDGRNLFDPEAARIVLRSRIPQKVMFGLDICNTAMLRKAEFDQVVAVHTPITDLFREDLGNRYPGFLKNPAATAYMWDSLAAAYLVDPVFVTKSQTLYLDVLTAWGRFYGSTVPLDRRSVPDATPVTVMLGLDFKRVFGLYKDRLTQQD